MVEQEHVVVGIVCFGILSIAMAVLLWRWCFQKPSTKIAGGQVTRTDSMNEKLQSGIAKLRHDRAYYLIRRGISGKPLFNWSDHPSLITDAVEQGWSRFAFTAYMSSSSSSSPSPTAPSASARLLGLCAAGDFRRDSEPEMSWEICHDSADFMQKIRLNPGLRKALINTSATNSSTDISAMSVIRTALPLPGPALGKNSSFPQEAYFEITVMYCRGGEETVKNGNTSNKVREGERTKLIQESSETRANSESLVHFGGNSTNRGNAKVVEDSKLGGRDGGAALLSIGLTAGGSLPLKLPGSYPGSIGFNADGSVFVDGIKLVFASEKAEWGRTDVVIGCGFDPKHKKVYFTVDSEVIHVVHCKSEEFGTPLYPTMAANSDVVVLVNFGQSVFKYVPANSQRTPNPCFVGPLVNSPAATIGHEDSKELFSMGRIDSQWLNRCTTRGSQNLGNPNRTLDFDEESEADLFEIVLDSCGRSPNVVSQ